MEHNLESIYMYMYAAAPDITIYQIHVFDDSILQCSSPLYAMCLNIYCHIFYIYCQVIHLF